MSLSGSVGPDLVDAAQELIEQEPQLAEFRISEALRDALVSLVEWRQSSGGEPI